MSSKYLISSENPGDFSGFQERLEQREKDRVKKNPIDIWANFFFNEKLDPKQLNEDSVMELIYLCEVLAAKRSPTRHPYKDRLVCRRLAVDTALDLGIDLIDFKDKWNGKIKLGRGLLDIWLIAYKERYGSTFGTRGEWEAKRRDVKTRLAKARRKGIPNVDAQTDGANSMIAEWEEEQK